MRRWLPTGLAALLLVGMYVMPFIVFENPYGEVPIPGSATVHLPPGEVHLVLHSLGRGDGQPVPPLSIHISAPAGTPQPEIIVSPRTKTFTADGTIWSQVWTVDVERDADYHVEIDGEVYGPYQPRLTFRHMGNDVLGVLALVCCILSSFVFSTAVVAGVAVLLALALGFCARILAGDRAHDP